MGTPTTEGKIPPNDTSKGKTLGRNPLPCSSCRSPGQRIHARGKQPRFWCRGGPEQRGKNVKKWKGKKRRSLRRRPSPKKFKRNLLSKRKRANRPKIKKKNEEREKEDRCRWWGEGKEEGESSFERANVAVKVQRRGL